MYKFVFFLSTCFIGVFSFAQDGLLIKNIKTGKAWVYEKNAKITYIKFQEEEYTTGILNELIDTSAVILGNDTVILTDIAGIRKKSPLRTITRIAGMPFMLLGSLAMANGIEGMFRNSDTSDGLKTFILGAGFFALGYLPYQINFQDLTVGFRGEWTIQIIRGKPSPQ